MKSLAVLCLSIVLILCFEPCFAQTQYWAFNQDIYEEIEENTTIAEVSFTLNRSTGDPLCLFSRTHPDGRFLSLQYGEPQDQIRTDINGFCVTVP